MTSKNTKLDASATEAELNHETNGIVDSLHAADKKLISLRKQAQEDPDTMSDKLIKLAVPSLAGMIAGKLFQTFWDSKFHGDGDPSDENADKQGLLMSLVFAAASAAFGAVITTLSDRGSQAFVNHRQTKRNERAAR